MEVNYPQLQNLIKRDPSSYVDEFRQQYEHFQSVWALLGMGQSPGAHLEAMLMFVAHCASSYRDLTGDFGELLVECLENVDRLSGFEQSLRRSIVLAALLLKRDKIIDPSRLIPVLFKVLQVRDKPLRQLVTSSITGDLRKATPQLAKRVLNFLEQTILSVDGLEGEDVASAALQSLAILITVYAKNSSDVRPANIIANAGLNDRHIKMMLLALNFMIGQEHEGDEGSESDPEDEGDAHESIRDAQVRMRIAGKTKSRQAKLERLIKKQKRKKRTTNTAFPAIRLLYDPQRYAERLLANLKRSTAPFEAKLAMMNALSLVIGIHQLILPDIYPVLLRYLQPHQRQVTKVLCYCAQASHSALPGDLLSSTIRAIANNFVAEYCAAPVIAAGLNAIRECCARCPGAMNETLLKDLAGYKGYKDKSVMMAARSLIGLYREENPELLHRKDRGKPDHRARSDGSEGSDSDPAEELLYSKAQHKLLDEEEMARLGRDARPAPQVVNPDSLQPAQRTKLDKAQRLEHVRAGRDGKRRFGAAGKTAEHRASGKSQTNKVKRRRKLVPMLKRSKAGLWGGKQRKGR